LLACRPSLVRQPGAADGDRRPHCGPPPRPARWRRPRTPTLPLWCWKCAALAKSFWLKQGLFGKREFKAVQDVNFKLRKGHTLGVVGESGSGKTTMGLTLLRLHEPTGGEVIFDGQNLLKLSDRERQLMRRRIQIVFQNPYASLNPRFTIGQTLVEPMAIHGIGKDLAEREAACAQPAGKGGPGRPRLRQVPARVFRRPAPACGHRALPDAEP
jgi:peptide/nickel transport system ATP-binding protein